MKTIKSKIFSVIIKAIVFSIYLLFYSSVYSQSESFVKAFPYYEDLDNKCHYFTLNKHAFSSVQIYTVQANSGYKGLIFKGNNLSDKWVEPATSSAIQQIWDDNEDYVSSMHINVDASLLSHLILRFDIKQTFKTKPEDCYFRVLVNGEQVKSIKGFEYFNPLTNRDVFKRQSFDLSAFAGDKMRVTLQSLCRSDKDCVLIEYLSLDNTENLTVNDNNN